MFIVSVSEVIRHRGESLSIGELVLINLSYSADDALRNLIFAELNATQEIARAIVGVQRLQEVGVVIQ